MKPLNSAALFFLPALIFLSSCSKYYQGIISANKPERVQFALNNLLTKPKTAIVFQVRPSEYWMVFKGNLKNLSKDSSMLADLKLIQDKGTPSVKRSVLRGEGKWKVINLVSDNDKPLPVQFMYELNKFDNYKDIKIVTTSSEDIYMWKTVHIYYKGERSK